MNQSYLTTRACLIAELARRGLGTWAGKQPPGGPKDLPPEFIVAVVAAMEKLKEVGDAK